MKMVEWSKVLTIKNGKSQKKVIDVNGKYPIYGSGGKMGLANEFLCESGTTIIGRKGTINKNKIRSILNCDFCDECDDKINEKYKP